MAATPPTPPTPPTFPPDPVPPAEPAARSGVGHAGRRVNLLKLAQAQRGLIWCILARILLEGGGVALNLGWASVPTPGGVGPGPGVIIIGLGLLQLAVLVVTIVFVARLARAYGYHPVMAILGAIAIVVPCIGLLLLVLLNQRVIGVLQRAGVKVGFMGVNREEMNKLRVGVCHGCGYDLRGLTSPVCPECGYINSSEPVSA